MKWKLMQKPLNMLYIDYILIICFFQVYLLNPILIHMKNLTKIMMNYWEPYENIQGKKENQKERGYYAVVWRLALAITLM
jgi:hypothetical protein